MASVSLKSDLDLCHSLKASDLLVLLVVSFLKQLLPVRL